MNSKQRYFMSGLFDRGHHFIIRYFLCIFQLLLIFGVTLLLQRYVEKLQNVDNTKDKKNNFCFLFYVFILFFKNKYFITFSLFYNFTILLIKIYKMIRQKKGKAYLQKSSFHIESLQSIHDKENLNKEQPLVFQEGILNKFFKINNQSPFCYIKQSKNHQINRNQKPALYVRGRKSNSQVHNKQNSFPETQTINQENKQKILLLQTTGNSMLSFKKFKRKQHQFKHHPRPMTAKQQKTRRPMTAISSYRNSVNSDIQQHSLSKVLQSLSKRQSSQNIKQKISTSQALVMFSKVLRNNQNASRQLFKRRIKSHSSNERYKNVSINASKVKIESKNSKQITGSKNKLDFKSYLQKFHLLGNNKSQRSSMNNTKKEQDFNLEGWDTNQIEGF